MRAALRETTATLMPPSRKVAPSGSGTPEAIEIALGIYFPPHCMRVLVQKYYLRWSTGLTLFPLLPRACVGEGARRADEGRRAQARRFCKRHHRAASRRDPHPALRATFSRARARAKGKFTSLHD